MGKNDPKAAILQLEDFRTEKKAQKSDSDSGLFQGLKTKMPPVPGDLSEEARKHWYFIGEQLVAAGMLAEVDFGQFRILCDTWALYVKAQREVQKLGEYQRSPNGYEQLAPWAVSRKRHADDYKKTADKFYLSPRARQSVKIENPNQGNLDLD